MSATHSTSTEDHSAVIDSAIRLIPISEVAELLSCSQRHVQRLTDDGRMPGPVRLGGHLVRWNLAGLQDWIQNGCPESPSDRDHSDLLTNLNHPNS